MPSFISRIQRTFLRKKDDVKASKNRPTTGPVVQSEADLHTPEKEPLKPSSASVVAEPTKGKVDPHSPLSPKSPSSRSLPRIGRSNSKRSLNKTKPTEPVPQIALKLPEPNAVGQPVEPLFEEVGRTLLDKQVLDEKRLAPEEALQLLQVGSTVIVERGLDTLGIFRTHWHSENALTQQSLLSLFLSSLTPTKTTSVATRSGVDAFQSELRYTSDTHDITSILKWGLRHVRYEKGVFVPSGKTQTASDANWAWYQHFSVAEREAGYPASAFTSILLPLLPPVHAVLLKNLLDLVSSVAAHVDQNAMSGNRLSKALALWVIAPRPSSPDTFAAFYQQWTTASRAMEHIFLAFVRDMQRQHKLPTRLAELVTHYPFTKNSPPEDYFLPRPDLTTHQFKALLVRIKKTRPNGRADEAKLHPLELLGQALIADYDAGVDPATDMKESWGLLRSRAVPPSEGETKQETPLQLSQLASEESLRIMSLVALNAAEPLPPVILPPLTPRRSSSGRNKRRSFSLDHGRTKPPYGALSVLYEDAAQINRVRSEEDLTSPPNGAKVDWDSFSSSGFGFLGPESTGLAASLSSRSAAAANGVNGLTSNAEKRRSMKTAAVPDTTPSYVTDLSVVPLDEAFVDVWSDALLDPLVRENWPEFLLCQLSDSARAACSSLGVEWLIVERDVVEPPVPVKTQAIQRSPSSVSAATTTRFTRSFGRATAELASRKRFSLFTSGSGRSNASVRGRKESSGTMASQQSVVSEMGEVPPLPTKAPTSPATSQIGKAALNGDVSSQVHETPVAHAPDDAKPTTFDESESRNGDALGSVPAAT